MKFYTVKDKYIAYLKTLDTTVPNIAVPGTFSTKDHIFWRIGVVSCLGERK